jgi:chromosomal replication initiator protein
LQAQPRGRSLGTPTSQHAELLEDKVRRVIGSLQYSRYFHGQTRLTITEEGLMVRAGSDILARLIERRFVRELSEAAGTPRVSIMVDKSVIGSQPSHGAGHIGGPVVGATGGSTVAGQPQRATPLNRPVAPAPAAPVGGRQLLEEFVVGASNRLGHAAAVRFAEEDQGQACIFIHGPCGVGKTHLLRGIAARRVQKQPGALVRYTTAEAFTNEYIAAVRSGKIDAFRKSYRKLDLLCLDDVHFVASKEGTQAELLHTFDAIGQSGARVALASDEHPRTIAKLHERLVSRFLAGAVVKIEPPDPELRERLVRRLALKRGLELEEAAARLIAEHAATLAGGAPSVRELDGLLIQIEAVSRLLPEFSGTGAGGGAGGAVGVIAVRKALGLAESSGPARARRPLSIDAIYTEICRCMGVDPVELMGKGRHKRVVLARAVCVHLCRQHTTHSYPEIAKGMGRPNHSTVITAHQRLTGQLGTIGEGALEPEVSVGLLPEMKNLNLRALVEFLDERVRRVAAAR